MSAVALLPLRRLGTRAGAFLLAGHPTTAPSHVDSTGPPRFPDEPSRGFAIAFGPRPARPRLAFPGADGAAPTVLTMKAPTKRAFRGSITPLRHPLCTIHDDRSRAPCNNTLPAGGLHLCRTGVEPAGSLQEVSAHRHSPLQDLSWRNNTSSQSRTNTAFEIPGRAQFLGRDMISEHLCHSAEFTMALTVLSQNQHGQE